jgi:S1-C subfamily serine protease
VSLSSRRIVPAVLLGLLTSACTATPTPVPEAALASTVGIEAVGCEPTTERGTGVLLRDGMVLTAAHVIAGTDLISVVFEDETLTAQVVAFDPEQDLAVVRVDTARPGLSLGEIDPGDSAWVMAFNHFDDTPVPKPVEVVRHLAVTTSDIYLDGSFERPVLELTGQLATGDSGGALINESGEVGGIIYATSRTESNIGFALDIEALITHLSTAKEPLSEWGPCQ